mmetsp:Transcript_30139/g.65052  ORF Transcript_30139/g.65052 Transcript_30139/m.65052 type:complete len:265 (+) Transcript_30139:1090-1884(+)
MMLLCRLLGSGIESTMWQVIIGLGEFGLVQLRRVPLIHVTIGPRTTIAAPIGIRLYQTLIGGIVPGHVACFQCGFVLPVDLVLLWKVIRMLMLMMLLLLVMTNMAIIVDLANLHRGMPAMFLRWWCDVIVHFIHQHGRDGLLHLISALGPSGEAVVRIRRRRGGGIIIAVAAVVVVAVATVIFRGRTAVVAIVAEFANEDLPHGHLHGVHCHRASLLRIYRRRRLLPLDARQLLLFPLFRRGTSVGSEVVARERYLERLAEGGN